MFEFLNRNRNEIVPIQDTPDSRVSWFWAGVLTVLPGVHLIGAYFLAKKIVIRVMNHNKDRFREIAAVAANRANIAMNELSGILGRSDTEVRSDIEKMLKKGYLGSKAYLDRRSDVLCLTAPAPQPKAKPAESVPFWQSFAKKPEPKTEPKPEPKPEPRPEPKPEPKPQPKAGTQLDPSEYERILRRIRQLNDEIDDDGVSEDIDTIGVLTSEIFSVVRGRPELTRDVQKLFNNYLPMTFKLLEKYAELEKQSYQTDKMRESMRRIAESMKMLIESFRTLHDRLFRAESIDVDSDINALKAQLVRDGLFLPKELDIHSFGRSER